MILKLDILGHSYMYRSLSMDYHLFSYIEHKYNDLSIRLAKNIF